MSGLVEGSCRACGATSALIGGNSFGLCTDCEAAFRRRYRPSDGSEETLINEWLANCLRFSAKRLSTKGIVGRCEARSSGAGSSGHQCASLASAFREGRRVCTVHHNYPGEIKWANGPRANPYQHLGELIAELSREDALFASTVRGALSEASERTTP